jgi:hypothetical protein
MAFCITPISSVSRTGVGAFTYIPVVAPDGAPCAVPGQENYDEYLALAAEAPAWQNQITLESLEAMREFDPASSLPLLAPTPLLVIAGDRDSLVPMDSFKARLPVPGSRRHSKSCRYVTLRSIVNRGALKLWPPRRTGLPGISAERRCRARFNTSKPDSPALAGCLGSRPEANSGHHGDGPSGQCEARRQDKCAV